MDESEAGVRDLRQRRHCAPALRMLDSDQSVDSDSFLEVRCSMRGKHRRREEYILHPRHHTSPSSLLPHSFVKILRYPLPKFRAFHSPIISTNFFFKSRPPTPNRTQSSSLPRILFPLPGRYPLLLPNCIIASHRYLVLPPLEPALAEFNPNTWRRRDIHAAAPRVFQPSHSSSRVPTVVTIAIN
ncbi:hypothetical protein CROQUDRAFT_94046 [Cronartium quercuum f. sp. fusiforme G11]|uniref:Uncharacterized protein n=1 Tax=Cronartium quercuum f. sp. fusiforme G11 TaxID=708437 RepID=A0A9P6TAL0_9BASI|nr:hypothetical protein CROQUDRAFT_94046 [Cronartium quercuum f. sp. fusiforme G11]